MSRPIRTALRRGADHVLTVIVRATDFPRHVDRPEGSTRRGPCSLPGRNPQRCCNPRSMREGRMPLPNMSPWVVPAGYNSVPFGVLAVQPH